MVVRTPVSGPAWVWLQLKSSPWGAIRCAGDPAPDAPYQVAPQADQVAGDQGHFAAPGSLAPAGRSRTRGPGPRGGRAPGGRAPRGDESGQVDPPGGRTHGGVAGPQPLPPALWRPIPSCRPPVASGNSRLPPVTPRSAHLSLLSRFLGPAPARAASAQSQRLPRQRVHGMGSPGAEGYD